MTCLFLMKNRSLRARRIAPVLSIVSLAMNAAFAQNTDQSAMVITASRFESSPQDKPIAAQIITADEIRDSSATTVGEVLGKLGGVHTRISFTGIPDSSVDMRGFGMTGDQNTLVLVNGQRLSENEGASARLSSIPLSSIERIEILRGAGAVLYGGGATGGTINIITRAPLEDGVTGAASALLGSYNLQDLHARMQTRNGDWGVSLHGQKYKTDNYRQGNQAELEALSGEIRHGGKENFVALSFGADDQKSRLPGVRKVDLDTGLNQFLNDPRGVTTPNDYLNSKSDYVSVRGEKRVEDVTVALDVIRRHKTRQSYGSYDWGGTSLTDSQVDITTFSPRMLWGSKLFNMSNMLTLGGDWSDWSYRNNTVGTSGSDTFNEQGKQNGYANYFRNELQVAEKTRLSFGYRREIVKQNSNLENSAGSAFSSNRMAHSHVNANDLAIQQGLADGFSLFARTGESFRIANIDENRCIWGPCGDLLKPQTARQKEIGTQWQGSKASARLSVFDIDLNNEIHYNALTGSNMNLAPTHRQGFELDGKVRVGKSLDMSARYVRTQARFRDGAYDSYMGFSASIAGKDVPLVPKDRFGVNLGWQMAAATRVTAGMNYVGPQRYDNDQANKFLNMPSYTTADLKINHKVGAWNLAAGVNNVFDKAYYSYGVTNVASVPSRYNVYPEARRNGYVSAEYQFWN